MTKKYIQLVLLGLLIVACQHESVTEEESLALSWRPLEGRFVKHDGITIVKSPNTLQLEDYLVWGGSVIKGKDDKYHMLFSLWESGEECALFQDGWLINSKIAYTVSDYPNKEFKFQKIVLSGRALHGDSWAWDAQSVHNPHIKEFNQKGNLWDPNWRDVHGVAIGNSPTGPFTALDDFVFDIRLENGKVASKFERMKSLSKNQNSQ
jgi:hypothetical protein